MRLLTAVLFFVFSHANQRAEAQTATKFQINANYGKGNVAFYPDGIFWITKSAFKAKAYPAEDALWSRFYYPGTEPVVAKSAFDSLLNRFDSLSSRLKVIESKQQQTVTPLNLTSLIKISQLGTGLIKFKNDTTAIVPSFIPSADIDFVVTDSTIQPIFKKH